MFTRVTDFQWVTFTHSCEWFSRSDFHMFARQHAGLVMHVTSGDESWGGSWGESRGESWSELWNTSESWKWELVMHITSCETVHKTLIGYYIWYIVRTYINRLKIWHIQGNIFVMKIVMKIRNQIQIKNQKKWYILEMSHGVGHGTSQGVSHGESYGVRQSHVTCMVVMSALALWGKAVVRCASVCSAFLNERAAAMLMRPTCMQVSVVISLSLCPCPVREGCCPVRVRMFRIFEWARGGHVMEWVMKWFMGWVMEWVRVIKWVIISHNLLQDSLTLFFPALQQLQLFRVAL